MQMETIALVGPGRLGTSLAHALRNAGYKIREIVCRNDPRSRAKGMRLARKVNAEPSVGNRAKLNADVIWFCVPDDKIAEVAKQFADRNWQGKIALHSSGVLSSDALDMLRQKGASVASVHPLMTFVENTRPALAGVPFAIEGDASARRIAARIVRNLGGDAFVIRKQGKIAYHAFATMICPLFISLLATAEKTADLAGISSRNARRRMMSILRQSLTNYERMGPGASFSGPIVRGDVETIARHLAVLRKVPEAMRVYVALASAALKYLPVRNRNQISDLLAPLSRTARRN